MSVNKELVNASRKGNTEKVRMLLQNGADPCVYSIMCAASKGFVEIVKLLLQVRPNQMKADVHVNDNCPIRYAAFNGHAEMVKVLLEHGANPHAWDDFALKSAESKGYADVVAALLEKVPKTILSREREGSWVSDPATGRLRRSLKPSLK